MVDYLSQNECDHLAWLTDKKAVCLFPDVAILVGGQVCKSFIWATNSFVNFVHSGNHQDLAFEQIVIEICKGWDLAMSLRNWARMAKLSCECHDPLPNSVLIFENFLTINVSLKI